MVLSNIQKCVENKSPSLNAPPSSEDKEMNKEEEIMENDDRFEKLISEFELEEDNEKEENWLKLYADLQEFKRIHGHTRVPQPHYEENAALGRWVAKQRMYARKLEAGEGSPITLKEIQLLQDIDFEWNHTGNCWEKRYEDLEKYHANHGHCNVSISTSDPSEFRLAEWVAHQRMYYRLWEEGKPSSMTPRRVVLLESLGFQWNRLQNGWKERLRELKEFKKNNGHCNVPAKYDENPSLARWVRHQREQYRRFQTGIRSFLSKERIEAMDNLGFDWEYRGPFSAWECKLDELKRFKEVHGHCNVPKLFKYDKSLGTWTRNQRTQYRNLKAGKKSPMTPERIAALEKLGFEWNLRKNASSALGKRDR